MLPTEDRRRSEREPRSVALGRNGRSATSYEQCLPRFGRPRQEGWRRFPGVVEATNNRVLGTPSVSNGRCPLLRHQSCRAEVIDSSLVGHLPPPSGARPTEGDHLKTHRAAQLEESVETRLVEIVIT